MLTVTQVQTILADAKSQELFEVLRRERDLVRPTPQDLVNLRRATEKAIGADENLFRMVWVCSVQVIIFQYCTYPRLQLPDSKMVTVQLIGKDDSEIDDAEVQTGRWEAYVQSFASVSCSFKCTAHVLTVA